MEQSSSKSIVKWIKQNVIIDWIKQNVTADVVPADEGNSEALVYNLVQLAKYGRSYRRYNYEKDQDEEIKSWNL